MGFRDSLFKKKDGAEAGGAASGRHGAMCPACGSVPFYASLQVSPDESLVCCVTPEKTVVAYDTGSDRPKWSLPVPSSALCECSFVGPDRLLVLSEKQRNDPLVPLVLLLDTANGRVVARTTGPKTSFRGDSDPGMGLYVGGGLFDILTIGTTGDRLEMSVFKSGQVDLPGPKIGPDGKHYFISTWSLRRIDGDEATVVMDASHCIYPEPPGKIYCGGGYHDRSGASALNILDLETGSTSALPWGREPVSQIFPGGDGHLLVGSETDIWGKYPSAVTSFCLADKRKKWSLPISGLPQMRPVILETAPAEGWGLIQTHAALNMIALEDGKTLRSLPRESQHFATAKWLPSRRLLYIAGNPFKERAGMLECYRL